MAGAPARFLILDDGWQSVEDADAPQSDDPDAAAAAAAAAAAEEEAVLNDPSATKGANIAVSLVASMYRALVHGSDYDTPPVWLWRKAATTVLKSTLKDFFKTETPFSRRLSSFAANGKFENPEEGTRLRDFVSELKTRRGLDAVYCWHTLGGYWGGVSTTSPHLASLEATVQTPSPTRGLLETEPALAWDAAALHGVGVVDHEKLLELFHGMHGYLADAGVDGVKVDGQSGLVPFGGAAFVRRYVRAMEASVAEHFDANRCINCMCHASDNIFAYRTTAVLRAADDFYPTDPASHPAHIRNVAYNSVRATAPATCHLIPSRPVAT